MVLLIYETKHFFFDEFILVKYNVYLLLWPLPLQARDILTLFTIKNKKLRRGLGFLNREMRESALL